MLEVDSLLAHGYIVRYLSLALHSFVAARQLGDVVFALIRGLAPPNKFREPDVALMLTENSERRSNGFWTGAVLVIEAVSDDPKSRDRDMKEKLTEHAAARTEEHWIVDSQQQQITVLRLAARQYATQGVCGIGDEAPSNLLAGFSLRVADVFVAANGTVLNSGATICPSFSSPYQSTITINQASNPKIEPTPRVKISAIASAKDRVPERHWHQFRCKVGVTLI